MSPPYIDEPYALRKRFPYPLWLLYRTVRVLLVASAFAWFWGGAVVLAWLVMPLLWLKKGTPIQKRKRAQDVLRKSFRLFHAYMHFFGLVTVSIDDALIALPKQENDPSETQKGRLYIANHTTLVDVTALLAHMPHVCCVAKSSYSKSTFVGRLLRLCGFIPAGTDAKSQKATLEEASLRLAEGFDVLIFPEGTRSPPGSMHPFQRGAFEIACKTQSKVICLHLECKPYALTKGKPIWTHPDLPAKLKIVQREVCEASQFQYKSRMLRDHVETLYRSYLSLLPLQVPSSKTSEFDPSKFSP